MRKNNFPAIFSIFAASVSLFSCLITEETLQKEVQEKSSGGIIDKRYKIDPLFDFEGTVARWFNFHEAASSVTLDDGTYDQYAAAFPVMEELGIKGTFYLIADKIEQGEWNDKGTIRKMMSWDDAAIIADTGHEIGSHSLNHYDMSQSGIDLDEELFRSREFIEQRLPGVKVETFCWPHWRESAEALQKASEVYLSARTGNGIIAYYLQRNGGIPSDPPENMHKVNAFGFLISHKKEEWEKLIDRVYEEQSWFVSSYHGVDNGELSGDYMGWNPLTTDIFRETLSYPMKKGFWIDTFANVSKYIFERDNAELHLKNRGYSIELTLNDGLEDSLFDQKISLSLKKPDNWTFLEVLNEKGEHISFREENNVIFLNIFPDGALLTLKPLLTEEKMILE